MTEPDIRELRQAMIAFCAIHLREVREEIIDETIEGAIAELDDDLDDVEGFALSLIDELGGDPDQFLDFLQSEGYLESWSIPDPSDT